MAYETTGSDDRGRDRRLRDRPMGVAESLAAVAVGCGSLVLIAASVGLFCGVAYRVFLWAAF